MWKFKYTGSQPVEKSPIELAFLSGKEYVVGRKDCEILLLDDPSISRKHAVIVVDFAESNLGNPSLIPTLTIADFSKFGTYINGSKMSGGKAILKDGDEVKFGQMNNAYLCSYSPMVVSSSALQNREKQSLKSSLVKLGGHLVNEWTDECGYLVMQKASITVKAILALVSLKPLVTVEYFSQLVESISNKTEQPSLSSYSPAVTDPGFSQEMLMPNACRQSLLEGKTVFFCHKAQYDRMSSVVRLAGGSPILLENRPRSLSVLSSDDSILMYCEPNIQPSWYKDCHVYLDKHGKRYIQDAEVGHAILYCSTADHCNPEKNAGARLHEEFSQRQSQSLMKQTDSTSLNLSMQTAKTIAEETQKANQSTADRSFFVKEMLPPPSVTIVLDTQENTRNEQVTASEPAKRKAELLSSDVPAKRKTIDATTNETSVADRSLFVKDILPPPPVTVVLDTQENTRHGQITASGPAKRKADDLLSDDAPAKRKAIDASSTNETRKDLRSFGMSYNHGNTSLLDDLLSASPIPSASKIADFDKNHAQEHKTEISQITVVQESHSTLPTMRDAVTPPPQSVNQEYVEDMDQSMVSVVNETQSSGTLKQRNEEKPIENLQRELNSDTPCIKIENTHNVRKDLQARVTEICSSHYDEFSEDRKLEIGDCWDVMQVDYATLLYDRKGVNNSTLPERDGLVLWKGVWVPNYKRFKKCGKKDAVRLPTIIGGGDLVNALSSQPDVEDGFLEMKNSNSHAKEAEGSIFNALETPQVPKRTMKSSAFGGNWELPTSKV